MISTVILTKNEEADLPACLQSLAWCDDIHVLDSGSVDNTTVIAKDFGARVWTNAFEGFGKQRNYALDHLPFKWEWVLFLDADEQATQSFKKEIVDAVTNAGSDIAGFYCCCKLMLEGRWLKRSDTFPIWQFRLVRRGKARYANLGHGQKECEVNGEAKYIKEPYLHYGMAKGWTEWIDRHNRYATQEAVFRYQNRPPFRQVFNKHRSLRNVALKCWLSKWAAWPFLRFFHAYFFKLGFLEGEQGFLYCVNNFYYEFMISIKYRECKRMDRLKTQPAVGPGKNFKHIEPTSQLQPYRALDEHRNEVA